jgi:2-amino-4-hydroxy-6-hydroxymethyldihydropteridine diphosphokinase
LSREVPVAIALGSNLGDRERQLREAGDRLGEFVTGLVLSPFIETDPVDVAPQPRFLNAAAVGHTELSARRLLERLLETETASGRDRPFPGAPRTLDLDLILYGDAVIDEPGLIVPHPRFRERAFVLAPLAAIAPGWRDPITGMTVGELLERLTTA